MGSPPVQWLGEHDRWDVGICFCAFHLGFGSVLPVATTILAGRDGQASRPPASSCAGHRLCRYTVRVNSIDTPSDSHKGHYVNPSTRGSPRMPKERRARSLTVSAVSLTFKVDTARRQRMLRTESSQDGRTKIARAQPRIRDGERTSSTLTAATSPSPTPSATRHCRRPICRKQRPDQHQQGRRAFTLLVCCVCPADRPICGAGERGASFTCG